MNTQLKNSALSSGRRNKAVIFWGLWLVMGFLAADSNAWYMPEQGRWLSRDPIGEAGGLNIYGYVDNSSIDDVDPLGLDNLGGGGQNEFINAVASFPDQPQTHDDLVDDIDPIGLDNNHPWGGGQNEFSFASTGFPGELQGEASSSEGTATALESIGLAVAGHCPATGTGESSTLLPPWPGNAKFCGAVAAPGTAIGTTCRAANHCSATCKNACGTWPVKWPAGYLYGTVRMDSRGKRYCHFNWDTKENAKQRCKKSAKDKCAAGPPGV